MKNVRLLSVPDEGVLVFFGREKEKYKEVSCFNHRNSCFFFFFCKEGGREECTFLSSRERKRCARYVGEIDLLPSAGHS